MAKLTYNIRMSMDILTTVALIVLGFIAVIVALMTFLFIILLLAAIERQAAIKRILKKADARQNHPAYGKLRAVKKEE